MEGPHPRAARWGEGRDGRPHPQSAGWRAGGRRGGREGPAPPRCRVQGRGRGPRRGTRAPGPEPALEGPALGVRVARVAARGFGALRGGTSRPGESLLLRNACVPRFLGRLPAAPPDGSRENVWWAPCSGGSVSLTRLVSIRNQNRKSRSWDAVLLRVLPRLSPQSSPPLGHSKPCWVAVLGRGGDMCCGPHRPSGWRSEAPVWVMDQADFIRR